MLEGVERFAAGQAVEISTLVDLAFAFAHSHHLLSAADSVLGIKNPR